MNFPEKTWFGFFAKQLFGLVVHVLVFIRFELFDVLLEISR